MVAIVSGNSLGLSLSSLETLGQRGTIGTASQGRNGELAYVNAATGNLVLQSQDDRLVGRGPDIHTIRTYNSQGQFTDDNGDNWSVGVYAQQMKLTGTVGTAGSTVTRTGRDGAQAVYTYDTVRGLYVSTAGSGAYDTISHDSVNNRFVWQDGDSGLLETYENSAQSKLLSSTDPNGNSVSYTYNGNGTLASITTANGESTYFDYSGTLLTSVRTVVGGTTLTRTHYAYDASNRLASVTTDLTPQDNSVSDGVRYITSYTYDGTSKRVASITQSDGTSLAITYVQVGADYRVATLTDGSGTTSYSYDTANRKTSVTNPLGHVTVLEYDTSGQLTKVTGPAVNGVSSSNTFVYNANGDVIQVVDAQGNAIDMAYDANGNQVSQRDAAGNTITRTFNAQNQLLTETVYIVPDPDGAGAGQPSGAQTTRHVYDASYPTRLRFSVSPEGQVTEYRYNSYGERTATLRYLGGAFDVSALGVTVSPTASAMTSWVGTQNLTLTQRTDTTYDARGQAQSITTYARVDASGQGVTDGSQSVTQFVHSRAGELLQTIAPDTGLTTYTYDGLGRLQTTQNALGQTSATSYDDGNRQTTVTQANGLITTSTYDLSGRLVGILHTDSLATNLGTTQYTYDAAGRLRMTQDATGVRTWLLYDEAGRKVADIDGNGTLTEYLYNKNHQVTQVITYATPVNVATLVNGSGQPTNPALSTVRPTTNGQDRKSWNIYDAAGRLVKTVDNQGAVTETQYDGASRVVKTIQYANTVATSGLGAEPTSAGVAPSGNAADRITRHFHDGNGQLVATLDAEGFLTEYQRNAAGQAVRETRYATATNAAFRASGTLAQLRPATHAGDAITRHILNAKGQAAGRIDAEGYLTEYVYDGNGNTTQTIRYATALSAATLTSITVSTTVASLRPAGHAEDQATVRTFDALNRVLQETNPEGTVTQFVYDNAGNLVSRTQAATTTESRTLSARYDKLGRLIGELGGNGSALLTGSQTQAEIDTIWAQHGLTHAYDAAGRRTSTTDAYGQKTLYFYDVDGRLTHTVNPLGEVVENQYNTLGQLATTIRYGTRISLTGLTGTQAGGLVNATLTAAIGAIQNLTLDSKTTYTYAANGAVASSTDALGNATGYTYNTFGDVTGLEQAISSGLTLQTTFGYDRRGLQISSAQDASGINAVTSAIYDAFGRVSSRTDANGNLQAFNYDRLGRVVSTTDALGGNRTSTYDAFGRTLTHTDALGKTTAYSYSRATRSVTVTTPESITVTTTATRLGQTLSITDGRGIVTTYGYDKNGNLLSTTRAGVTETTQAYDRADRLVTTTDALGRSVELTYDAANRVLTRTVDPSGLNLITTYQYDAKGQQVGVVDPNGTLTQLVYDLKGQLIRQVIDPSGLNLITQYTYDGRGKTLTITSPNGSQVQYTYDKLGRRTQEQTDPTGLNLTRSYAYDKNGNVVSTTDPNGAITRYAYDANNRLIYTLDPLGRVRKQGYDAEGRMTLSVAYATAINTAGLPAAPTVAQIQARVTTSGLDAIDHRVYDADGRLSASVNALGEVVRYVHDANGNVIEQIAYANRVNMGTWAPGNLPVPSADPTRDLRQRTVYDNFDRATYTINGVGSVVHNTYDASGNLVERIAYAAAVPVSTAATATALTDAVALIANSTRDNRVRMVYDAANRVTWIANGTGAVTQNVYDGNGNTLKTIEYATAIGQATAPSSAVASATDRITAYVYDAANRQTYTINALGGVTQAVYDKNGNVTQRIGYASAISAPTAASTHTAAGISATLTLNVSADRITRMAYDAANRLAVTVDPTGAVTDTTYDASGHAVEVRRYATVISTTGLSTTASVADIRARITANAQADRTERQTFDAAGQRTYTVNSLGHVTGYSYDGVGRLTQSKQYALAIPSATANTGSGVAAAIVADTTNDRTTGYAYDAAGRLLSSTDALGFTETYSYDGLGQKLSFTNKKSAVWTYAYDAAGRMVRETSPQVQLTTLSSGSPLSVNEAQSGLASVVTAMAYDALGNLTSRTEAQGRSEERTTQYEYDTLGRQVKTIFPPVGVYVAEGSAITSNGFGDINGVGYTAAVRTDTLQTLFTQVTYDALGNAVANRDMAGNMSYKAYDLLGRVAFDVDAMGYVTAHARNAWGEVTQLTRYSNRSALTDSNPASLSLVQVSLAVTDSAIDHSADRILFMEYDQMGRTTKVTEPQGFAYDSSGIGQQYFTAAEKVTRNTYNAFGDLTRVAQLRNQSADTWVATNHYFDKLGRETATVDALGYLTTQAFDASGNVVSRTEFKTAVAAWNGMVAPTSAPTTATHIDDRTTLSVYDRAGRKTSETRVNVTYSEATTLATSSVRQRGNLTTTFGYDAVGNQTRVTDASGASTYTYFDALGRITATAAPARNSTTTGTTLTPLVSYRRDAYGNALVTTEHAQGAATASETAYTANANAADHKTLARYDSFGHLTQVTDAMGVDHHKSYNAQGLLAKEWQAVTGHDGNTQTLFRAYEYDKLGQKTAVIDPASNTLFQGDISLSYTSATRSSSLPYTLSGNNSFTINWSLLTDGSGGNVKIELTYNTLSTYSTASYQDEASGQWVSAGGIPSRTVVRSSPEFGATAAATGISWSWPNDSNNDGGISGVSYVKVMQKVGDQWIVKWEGSIASAQALGVSVRSQADSGVTETQYDYNAFGELTQKGIDGGAQESFQYDNAGNLWRTNSGDGVDKVYLYDLLGNQTAHIQSAGLGRGDANLAAFATADQIATLSDVRRTDVQYDALGRVTAQLQPERMETVGGVTLARQFAQFNVTGSSVRSDTLNEDGHVIATSWPGTNTVSFAWASFAGLGSGDVRVEFSYHTRGPLVRVGGTISGYDEYGQPIYVGGTFVPTDGPLASRTELLRADQTVSGANISWTDPNGSVGGATRVTGLKVYKKDIQGNWVLMVDQTLKGYKGNVIEVTAPADPSTSVQLEVRPAGSPGSTGWTTVTMTRFDGAWRYDASSLAAGSWEYRVLTTPTGGTTSTTANGSLTIALPTLAVISSTRTVSAHGHDVYSWPAPATGVQQVFRVRAAGSSGAWTTLPVNAVASGYTGVNLSGLSSSSTYDYELLWTPAGELTPNAHAIGQITIGASSTGTRSVPYQAWVQYIASYNEFGQPVYGWRWETRYQNETYTIPRPYTATTTTAPNTTAVSESLLSAAVITQLTDLNGGSTYVRPVVNQTVDRWGNVTSISDPRAASWVTTFSYDANNQLIEQVQPDAQGLGGANAPVTRIYYDKLGNQIAVQDANGHVNGQVFDAAGQLVTERHADGGIVTYNYDAFGNKTKTTDARGNATTYDYDKLNRLLTTTSAAVDVYQASMVSGVPTVGTATSRSIVETNTWDQAGRKLTQTNGNGETTKYTYDLRGNILRTTFPLTQSALAVYDSQNRKIAEVDANGFSNTWTYDYFGTLRSHTDLGYNRYTYTYDHARQLVSQTNTLGLNKSYQYDAAGQLTQITDTQLNHVTRYAYDLAGNHIQETTTQGGVTYQDNHLAYDALGRLRWVGDSRAFVSMEYDLVGNRTRIFTSYTKTAQTAATTQDRYFKYDAMNRQTVVDAVNAAGDLGSTGHAITYDLNGNRLSDSYWGNKVTSTQTQIGRTVTGYVAVQTTEPDGQPGAWVFTYVTNKAYLGTPPTVYTYGVVGYGEYGAPIYGYTPTTSYPTTPIYGKTLTQTQGLTAEQYTYDANNNLTAISRDGMLLESRHYDGAARVVRNQANVDLGLTQYGSSISSSWTDAKAKEYTDKLYGAGVSGAGTDSRVNVFDGNGRLLYTRVFSPMGSTQYSLNYRKADGSANYDAAGNQLGYQLLAPAYTNTYTNTLVRRDAYKQGTQYASSTYFQAGSSTHSYDAAGNLTSVTDSTSSANNRSFVNDAAGRILTKTQGASTERQLVVNGEVLARFTATSAEFTFGYRPISGSYPAATPGAYTVSSEDSLQSIAKAAYGDSSLWYLVAEANGLASSRDLRVGQTLTLPTHVQAKNSASTFTPYDPSAVIGDTSPNMPTPPPPKKDDGCGGIGKVFMIAVAVVATVLTAGVLTAGIGQGLGAIMSSGFSALTGGAIGTGLTGGLLGSSALAAATIGGAVGSIASQVVGNAFGVVDGFSWKNVALSALSAGVSAGVGQLMPIAAEVTGFERVAAFAGRAAVTNALTQGIGVVTGLQEKFNWRGVAASAVGAGVGQAVAPGLEKVFGSDPVGQFATRFVTGLAAGTAAAVMQGGKVAIQQVATDAFGNALGSMFLDYAKNTGLHEVPIDENQRRAMQMGMGPLTPAAAAHAVTISKIDWKSNFVEVNGTNEFISFESTESQVLPKEFVQPNRTQVAPPSPLRIFDNTAAVYTVDNLMAMPEWKIQGSGSKDLANGMINLGGYRDATTGQWYAYDEQTVSAGLDAMVRTRGVSYEYANEHYSKFYDTIKDRENRAYDAGQKLLPFMEGANTEQRVPMLSMSVSGELPDNSKHMGSIEQLRFGKMVGDALGGLDPVFGALLSPTGGIPGAGNVRVTNSLALGVAGGLEVVTIHGIAHDAAGYLLNYHQIGPGYQYIPNVKGWISTNSPLGGQQSGLNFYGNIKLYGSPTAPNSQNSF